MIDDLFVIDTETGIHNRGEDAIGKNKAAPWHPDNRVLYMGAYNETHGYRGGSVDGDIPNKASIGMLVGQNIKFDIHYLMQQQPDFRTNVWPDVQIWDTQLAE